MAIVFLGERPQAFHIIGFALVLTGVFIAARKQARRFRRINNEAKVDRGFVLSDHRRRIHRHGPPAVMHDRTSNAAPPPPTVQRAQSAVPKRLRHYLFARRFRGDRPAPAAEVPLRLHLRRGRDRRRAPRQPPRLDEYGFVPRVLNDVSGRDQTTSLFGKTYAAPFGIPPMGSAALCAYRGDFVLARARRGHQPADVPFRLVTDQAGRRQARKSSGLVPGLPGRRHRAHRALIDRVADAGYDTFVVTARRAGAAQPREQHPQRLPGPARHHAADRLGHGQPSALAVRHLDTHADELRHAAFREHGRDARGRPCLPAT